MRQSCSLRKAKAETPQETPAAEAFNWQLFLVGSWVWLRKCQEQNMSIECGSVTVWLWLYNFASQESQNQFRCFSSTINCLQAKTEAPAAEASKGKPISVTFFGRVSNETEMCILIPTGYRGGYCFSSVKSQRTQLVLFADSSISHHFSWVVTFWTGEKSFRF